MNNKATASPSARGRGSLATAIDPAAIYRAAATAAGAGILVQDMDGTILWANAAYGELMGHDPQELIGQHPLTFALPTEDTPSPEEIAEFRHIPPPDGRPRVEVFRNVHSDGTPFWIEIHVAFDVIRDYGEVAILVARDVTDHIERRAQLERKSAEMRRLASTDSLTGLANRFEILRALEEALINTADTRSTVGLLNVDLDNFKAVNDSFGHAAGDAVLCHVADCLRSVLESDDRAARIGGDEFIVLFKDIGSVDRLRQRCARVISQSASPLLHDGATITTSLSIGAAIAPASGLNANDLLKRADFALYDAKQSGRSRLAIYDEALHARKNAEDALAGDLKHAIRTNALTYHFQPTMSLQTGEIQGFETLVRWTNPRLGRISPGEFLPLASSIGLIAQVDLAAFRAALNLLKTLRAAGYGHIRVGINGSAEFLGLSNFQEMFFGSLKAHKIPPQSLAVEVLETVVFSDVSSANPLAKVLQDLHGQGVTVLLDDFGTGYAGLTHLATLAVSGVKIDRSLTEKMLSERTSAKIIGMMHDLCSDLGMYAVTEGIETAHQANALRELGGTIMQGYWLAKAMPLEEIVPWLRTRPDLLKEMDASAIAATKQPRY